MGINQKQILKMKIWTDREGNKVTPKEFIDRWKLGLQGVTPLQQVTQQVRSTWIIIIGVAAGIVVSIIAIKTLWWLLIILVGAMFNTIIQQIGLWQKKTLLERLQGGIL
ncbi:MAG: hypothetical protein IH845_05320 [Nanoarchaeota archaeon]|nr:hypothetical protein [Nanoarchaeota archaeon]